MDGRVLALGSVAALAALSSRRGSSNQEKPQIHYDEYWNPDHERLFKQFREQGVDYKQLADAILSDSRSNMVTAVLTVSTYAYWKNGEQVFVIGPELQELFAMTDLNKVPEWAIQFPYKSYYVALPNCPWRLKDPLTGWHQVGGAYVRVMQPEEFPPNYPHRGPVISLVVWGLPNENARFKGDDSVAFAKIDIGDAYDNHEGLEKYFSAKAGAPGGEMTGTDPYMDPWKNEPLHREAVRNVLRVIVNSAIYMNTSDALMEGDPEYARQNAARRRIEDQIRSLEMSSKKGRQVRRGTEKLQKKKRYTSGANVIWIGRGEEAGKSRSSAKPSSGRKMRRHWVRGHWKFPARKSGERIAVWIKPFQRGSYDGPAGRKRTYKLGDE